MSKIRINILFELWAWMFSFYVQADMSLSGTPTNLNYRLPNETLPEHYDINLMTNVHAGERTFYGEVIIDIVIVETTTKVVLHARELNITKVNMKNPSTGKSEELFYDYERVREFLTLTRKNLQPMASGTKWKLIITYTAELLDEKEGFYLSKYTDDKGIDHYFAATKFESTNARSAFPCYDEPDKSASFTVTINHTPIYTAISNMPVNQALSRAGHTVFLTTPRISSFLVAFVVSDFEITEGVSKGLRQRVYSRSSTKDHFKWALESGISVAEYLSHYYGLELMLQKLDHVAIPDSTLGGKTAWGLGTYNEVNLLYNMDKSQWYGEIITPCLVGQEIFFSWMHTYVTIDWWNSLWLKQGLALSFAFNGLDRVYSDLDVWQFFHVIEYQAALYTDGIYSRSMTAYVQTPTEIESLFQPDEYLVVSFLKSTCVLLMWSKALPENIFRKGVVNLVTRNVHGTIGEEQLLSALETAIEEENHLIPVPIKEMMSTWTCQSGFPILTVTRNYGEGNFFIKQEAFHNKGTSDHNLTWYVPINYAVASNPDFLDTEATHYLLNVYEMKFDDVGIPEKDWLILNKQSFGFYRINYDARNWDLITEGLLKDPFKIHVRNRAQLMDDAYIFTTNNRLDHAILLKLMTYLKYEDQFAPWSTANDIMGKYISYLRGDENYDDLTFFIAEQISPRYKKLGINDIPGEHGSMKEIRSFIVNMACTIGLKACLVENNNKLKQIVRESSSLKENFDSSIYCNGLRQSDDKLFNLVYQKLMESADPAFRAELIQSMGCTQNKNQIKKFIHSSIDMSNGLRPEERYTLLSSVYYRGTIGLLTCIEFLNENWNIYGNLPNGKYNVLENDIRAMASYVVNKKQEEKFSALVAKLESSRQIDVSVATKAYKIVANNLQWLRKHGEPIRRWLAKYRTESANGVTK